MIYVVSPARRSSSQYRTSYGYKRTLGRVRQRIASTNRRIAFAALLTKCAKASCMSSISVTEDPKDRLQIICFLQRRYNLWKQKYQFLLICRTEQDTTRRKSCTNEENKLQTNLCYQWFPWFRHNKPRCKGTCTGTSASVHKYDSVAGNSLADNVARV